MELHSPVLLVFGTFGLYIAYLYASSVLSHWAEARRSGIENLHHDKEGRCDPDY